MIPRWFIRSRFWFVNLFQDEYMSREAMGILFATFIIHVPMYFYGLILNREQEIFHSHINYQNTYGPRRNRLTHSLLFEEFEMKVEEWRKFQLENQS